jgi:hypothetical protein
MFAFVRKLSVSPPRSLNGTVIVHVDPVTVARRHTTVVFLYEGIVGINNDPFLLFGVPFPNYLIVA